MHKVELSTKEDECERLQRQHRIGARAKDAAFKESEGARLHRGIARRRPSQRRLSRSLCALTSQLGTSVYSSPVIDAPSARPVVRSAMRARLPFRPRR